MCMSKSAIYIVFCHQNLDFQAPTPFAFSMLIHFTGSMFPVCTIDPIDPMNPIDPTNPIDPMNPIDPIDPID